ncbi:MAG: hypothetical protein GX456_18825 [Verrucomicrobia bacterium]|nr:hypothetical protein [Verrucomicrobiota bacterium]
MNKGPDSLVPSVYLKTGDETPWPRDKSFFYLLTGSGMFICRNNRFFHSCVPTTEWPSELAGQKPFCIVAYPKLAQRTFETVVGFFDEVARVFSSEAAVLICWNDRSGEIELVVPEQVGIVSASAAGYVSALEVEYEIPVLPAHMRLIGDIHSHVDAPAFASSTDITDEFYRPGVHLVVGRLSNEPPEFHCSVVVDGVRFKADVSIIASGYERRRPEDVPAEWFRRITTRVGNSAQSKYDKLRPDSADCSGDNQDLIAADVDDMNAAVDSSVPECLRRTTTSQDI